MLRQQALPAVAASADSEGWQRAGHQLHHQALLAANETLLAPRTQDLQCRQLQQHASQPCSVCSCPPHAPAATVPAGSTLLQADCSTPAPRLHLLITPPLGIAHVGLQPAHTGTFRHAGLQCTLPWPVVSRRNLLQRYRGARLPETVQAGDNSCCSRGAAAAAAGWVGAGARCHAPPPRRRCCREAAAFAGVLRASWLSRRCCCCCHSRHLPRWLVGLLAGCCRLRRCCCWGPSSCRSRPPR
jgi:hypothetical protein